MKLARSRGGSSVTRRDNRSILDHEDYGSPRGARPVHHALGNYEALSRREFDRSILQIDQESALYNIEEFIVSVVLVPVILAFHNPQPDHGLIHLAQRLVVPLMRAGVGERITSKGLNRMLSRVS